jgi:hypothetical protein
MKGRFFLLVCIYCFGGYNPAIAQNFYFSWSAGVGGLLYPHVAGPLQVSFPYSVTDMFGKTSQNTFVSKGINPYGQPKLMGSAINWEIGTLRNFFTFSVYGAKGISNFSVGYGRNYYFDLPHLKFREMKNRAFVFKPSISLSYANYLANDKGGDNYFGSINNDSNTVHCFGHNFGPTFSYHTGRVEKTENTQTLDFFYDQNDLSLIPKVTISNNQYKSILRWNIDIAYFIPFHERGGIKIFQDGWHALRSPRIIGLGSDGVISTLGGSRISSTPYKFHGLFIGATLGLNISSRLVHIFGKQKKTIT